MQAMKVGYKYVGKLHRVDNIFERKPNVYFQNYKKHTPIMTNYSHIVNTELTQQHKQENNQLGKHSPRASTYTNDGCGYR